MKTNNSRQSGFARIDRVLGKTAKDYNLENAVNKYKAIKHWHQIAAAFVEEAQSLTQAVDFEKGVLTVACLSREVAYKLKLLAQRIISALNQLLGRQMVFALSFQL